jgi:hypothetical protein
MSWSERYNVTDIDNELFVPELSLYNYSELNYSRKEVNSEKLKYLYNKNNIKKEFIDIGFNTPELYLYTQNEISTDDLPKSNYVVKPAHMSWSDHVYINTTNIDGINSCLSKSTNRFEPNMLKQCERGIIIEEFINVIYELKVFVLWGCPLIADLRTGNTEFNRKDFITKENDYLNWDKEYELIERFADKIKLDFFRIDFLYDGNKLYASECAFMPSTILPDWVTQLISEKWSRPYCKHYYPFLI